jgi:hypothetical protein
MTDVVIPLSTGSVWSDNELRFALRSLLRYVEDLGRIVVVGHRPAWLEDHPRLLYLPIPDSRKQVKSTNMIRKVVAACDHVGPTFVRMSDDQVVLRPVAFATLPAYGQPRVITDATPKGNRYTKLVHKTLVWLRNNGYPTVDFDQHCPMLYDRDTFLRMVAETPWQSRMIINSLYGCFARLTPKSPAGELVRYGGSESATCHRTILRRAQDGRTLFLNYRNASLTQPMRYALCSMFPDRAPWEGDDHGQVFEPHKWLRREGQSRRSAAHPRQLTRADRVRQRRRRLKHLQLRAMGPAARRQLRARRQPA